MQNRRGLPPGRGGIGPNQNAKNDIQEVNMVIRDQLSLLNSIRDEEEVLEQALSEIEAKIDRLEQLKRTNAKEITLDTNFLTKCYSSVVFADEGAKVKMLQIGRTLMMQRLVKFPDPYVTLNMQYDFIMSWQICLQQHLKVLKQMRISIGISVLDSIMNISNLINKYVAPVASLKEESLTTNAIKFRNNRLFNPKSAGNDDYK